MSLKRAVIASALDNLQLCRFAAARALRHDLPGNAEQEEQSMEQAKRVALVTGGSRGIGRAIAVALAASVTAWR